MRRLQNPCGTQSALLGSNVPSGVASILCCFIVLRGAALSYSTITIMKLLVSRYVKKLLKSGMECRHQDTRKVMKWHAVAFSYFYV